MEQEFMTVMEAAQRFRLTAQSIINKIRRGKIEALNVGGTYRIYTDQFSRTKTEDTK